MAAAAAAAAAEAEEVAVPDAERDSASGDGGNPAALLCPRCDTLILRPGAGRWLATVEARLPKTNVPPEGWPTPEDAVELIGEFWAVDVSGHAAKRARARARAPG